VSSFTSEFAKSGLNKHNIMVVLLCPTVCIAQCKDHIYVYFMSGD